jgi:hypothetical protein
MTAGEPPPGHSRPPVSAPGSADGEDNRTVTNIALVIGFLVLVGGGIWLVDAMLDARRADECMSAGRRNCNPLPVTPPASR